MVLESDMRRIHDAEQSSSAGPSRHESRARDALTRRKDELEMVLGVAGVGVGRLDRELRLAAADSQFKVLFGLAPDAAPSWPDIVAGLDPEDRRKLDAAINAAFERGEPLDLPVKTLWSDRGARWVALRGRIQSNSRGTRGRLILVARDATPEQRAVTSLATAVANERRSRDVAEAANRAKDEFLSVVSHELRSPLNAILGWNRILAIKRHEDSEVQGICPRIEQSAKAQLKMVNDLLDLGRIGTGKLRITPRQMKLSTIAAMAIDAIRPIAAAKGLEIVADLHGTPTQVLGDPDRLTQVVANLLSNAMKFTPAGGRISVVLRDVDGRTRLSVVDTGQGISAELLPYIFDRFRQGDSSTTRGAGGLGLGLTLAREIIALHGGTLAASSGGAGKGATFVVTLPTATLSSLAARDGQIPRTSSPSQLNGLSILVVDDEADARAVVAETLRLAGADVTIGDSARAALEYLLAPDARFDVLVTDIGMPEEDGYSLVRKLRTLNSGERIVAIALTGYASRGDVEAAIDAGFDLHVPKPVDFDSFVPILRRLAATR